MDFVDEQHVVGLQVREQCRKVPRTLQHGAGSLLQPHAELVGHDICQRRFAKARRPEDEHVVQGFATAPRGFDEQAHLGLHRRLALVVRQSARTYCAVHDVFFAMLSGNDSVAFVRHLPATCCSALRMRSSVLAPSVATVFNKRVTSGGL